MQTDSTVILPAFSLYDEHVNTSNQNIHAAFKRGTMSKKNVIFDSGKYFRGIVSGLEETLSRIEIRCYQIDWIRIETYILNARIKVRLTSDTIIHVPVSHFNDIWWAILFCGKMDSLKEKQFATKCKFNLQSFSGLSGLAVYRSYPG